MAPTFEMLAGDFVEPLGNDTVMDNGIILVSGDQGVVKQLLPDFYEVLVQWTTKDGVSKVDRIFIQLVTCSCTTPNTAAAGHNEYQCIDGTTANCSSVEVCYATNSMSAYESWGMNN
jgi:hypothetical protein